MTKSNEKEIIYKNQESFSQLKRSDEIEILNQKIRENEINYLDKIAKLQETINKLKSNYFFLKKSSQIKFSIQREKNSSGDNIEIKI